MTEATVIDKPEVKYVRWTATVYYRAAGALIDVEHDLEELDELQSLVECGPHWDTIDRIEIVRSDGRERELTVEEAASL